MLNLRIGGVSEHFNMPWHNFISSGKSQRAQVTWRDCPGGTGEMITLLEENQLDMAVLLTEGIIQNILLGGKLKIINTYVSSSLEWGVHIPNSNSINTLKSKPVRFAISRRGSGSHLMALMYAKQEGIPAENITFEKVGVIEGAMSAFSKKEVDAFLWERFTTEPYCKENEIKRADSIYTPWPCFVIAVNPQFYQDHQSEIETVLKGVFEEALALKNDATAVARISEKYGLDSVRVTNWFEKVAWSNGENLSRNQLENVIHHLKNCGSLPEDAAYDYSSESILLN